MKNYLTIENPDTKATVDFLSENIGVELSIENGRLRVVAKMMHGEEASTWDEHEIEWPIARKS